jgi:DNA-binding CsgD family transcriptional regulator
MTTVIGGQDPVQRPVGAAVRPSLAGRTPMLGVDAGARIYLANAAADALLSARTILCAQDGRLAAATPPGTAVLREAIRRAAEGAVGGQPLSLTCEQGTVVPVLVSPAPGAPAGDPPGLAWVLALPPDYRAGGPPIALLAAWFGLTPAEAEVALRAARGDGLRAIAAVLGIQHSTARSHLNRVFQKAGVRRQAELSWLVAHLPG